MRWLIAAAIPLVAFASTTPTIQPTFCSIDFISGYGLRGTMRFILTATPDSLPASGNRATRAPLDTASRTIALPAFAQVFHVEQVSKVAPASFKAALKKSANRVAVLSFNYGPDCSWGPAEGPAIWMRPGTRGLVQYKPLPESKWVGGIPTFYGTYAWHEPYPVAPGFQSEKGPKASAVEFMKFLDEVPPLDLPDTNRVVNFKRERTRLIALKEWSLKNPELARLWPISRFTQNLDWRLTAAPFDTVRLPLAGTYLFTLRVPGANPLELTARTPLLPDRTLAYESSSEWEKGLRSLPVTFEARLQSLSDSETVLKRYRRLRLPGVLYFSIDSTRFGRDSTVWRVGGDFGNAPSEMASDSISKARFLAMWQRIISTVGAHDLIFMTGTATRYRDGRVHLRFPLMAGPDTVGLVEARRLSRETYSR